MMSGVTADKFDVKALSDIHFQDIIGLEHDVEDILEEPVIKNDTVNQDECGNVSEGDWLGRV